VKRGKPLARKTPLKRGDSELKRTELKRGDKPMPVKSEKRKVQDRQEAKLKRELLVRDGGCVMRALGGMLYGVTGRTAVLIPRCMGALEKDEVVSRARGGSATDEANTQILCTIHNRWKEDHPVEAEALGVARHSWDR
jgi:hypothetical protein